MEKLSLSIGILSWKSGQTLVDTLYTYYQNQLLELTDDVFILFQEVSEEDKQIANHFNIPYIGLDTNIGIGQGFIKLAERAKYENLLLLEHDWKLIENFETTYNRLKSGIDLLNQGIHTIRYRHRKDPGFPHFSQQYMGVNWNYYDKEIQAQSPHLLDSVHWVNSPEASFPDKIFKQGEYYISDSEYGNWTNNPCLFNTQFYLDTVNQFAGSGIDLEGKIGYWWNRQHFKVAHGEGLFKHIDLVKYGR
jgi:hypothetical protein